MTRAAPVHPKRPSPHVAAAEGGQGACRAVSPRALGVPAAMLAASMALLTGAWVPSVVAQTKATSTGRAPAKAAAADKRRTVATPAAPRTPTKLVYLRKIAIDPGHGGDNLGAVGHLGTREKVLTLELAERFAELLRTTTTAEVVLLRTNDEAIALRERPRLANAAGADLLLSVHCNSNPDVTVRGMEVWFLSADSSLQAGVEAVLRDEGVPEQGSEPAKHVGADAVVKALRVAAAHERSEIFAFALAGALRRAGTGMRMRGVRQDAFGVLKEATMPAVVFEVGYISNAAENQHLLQDSTQAALGRGLRAAVLELEEAIAAEERARPAPAEAAAPPAPNASAVPSAPAGPAAPAAPAPPQRTGIRSNTAPTSASASTPSASAPLPPSKANSGSPPASRKVPQRRRAR